MKNLSPRRQRKRDAKIEMILDTALSVVVEEGLDALTVHRLADRLDYSAGALYRYFPSMAAVLVALQTRVIEAYRVTFHAGVEICEQAAVERALADDVAALFKILALADLYRGFVHHRPVEYHLVARTVADPRQLVDDSVAGPGVEQMLRILADVTARLAEAAEVEALRPGPAIERALVFWSGLQGVLQLRKLERFAPASLTLDHILLEMTRALLAGWGAEPAALVKAEGVLAQVTRERSLIEIVESSLGTSDLTRNES